MEDLQERGVEAVPEKDLLIMRKKLQLIDNRFDHYKKPQGTITFELVLLILNIALLVSTRKNHLLLTQWRIQGKSK